LATHRRVRGLSGTSLAWGRWEQTSEMTATLSEADRLRMTRSGGGALSSEQGLELFDAAVGGSEALVLPVPLDLRVLRSHARTGTLPRLFSELVRVSSSSSSRRGGERGASSLVERLAGIPEPEREGVVLELVRAQVATVLGHASAETIDTQRAFKELGFDSLTAVELRNRLNTATGLRLPATLIFDHPTTSAVASHLLEEVAQNGMITSPVEAELDKLEFMLSSMASEETERTKIKARLQTLLIGLGDSGIDDVEDVVDDADLESATDDEMFDLIDRELGGL
jgi:acyl carrier protein